MSGAAAATATALLGVTGVGYAFWTATGSGAGSAAATTASSLETSAAVVNGTLYPGGESTGTIIVSNANPFPVKVTAATFSTQMSVANAAGTCTTTGVTFAVDSPPSTTAPLTVAAKTGNTNGTADVKYTATMSNASDNGCQRATFTSTLSLAGQS